MLPPIRGPQASARGGVTRRETSSGFALPEPAAREAQALQHVTPYLGTLGLQAGWSPTERDAAARRRGRALLHELAGLQLALLAGGVEPARLSRLALLAEGETGADPELRKIIEGISLRARIELARRAS